jgi:hypothetical protein
MVMYSQDLLMKFSDRNRITFIIGLVFTMWYFDIR